MLFEASPTPMWVYDADTLAFLAVNDAAIRHYGYSRDEFLAMTIKDIRPPEDIPRMLVDVAARGGPGARRRRPGATCRTRRHADRRRDHRRADHFEGRTAALVVAHDVSERKRLERRLADAEKMEAIGRLAGGVAHDFNNLLTVIAGYAEILLRARRRRGAGGDRRAPPARPPALTRQLLAFSRRQVLHPKVLDLNEIVAGMETMLHRIIGDDVSVGIRLAPNLAPVEADRAQIERVILNLAANARDAMPGGGALTIETANVDLDDGRSPRTATGGPGRTCCWRSPTPASAWTTTSRKHLFEPFFTTKAAGAGTGLGPRDRVRRRQAERRRDLRLQRARPRHARSRSTCRRRPRRRAGGGRRRARGRGGTETIMVVEDDDGVRELVRLMLEANGYEVLTRPRRRRGRRALCTDARRRPAADRRRDARGQRQRARRAARRDRARHAHPVHVRLLRRGRPPPRRCSAKPPPSSRSRSPSATLARKVREVLDDA